MRAVALASTYSGESRRKPLLDSHIFGHQGAEFDCMEASESMRHDFRPWLAIVTGPATEPCDDPRGEGEIVVRMWVLLACGFALEPLRKGLQEWFVFGLETVFDGLATATITRLDQLHHRHRGDGGESGKIHERVRLAELTLLDVEAGTLEGAEQLLDPPATPIEIDDLAGAFELGEYLAGQQQPVNGRDPGGSIYLTHVKRMQNQAAGHVFRQSFRRLDLDGSETQLEGSGPLLAARCSRNHPHDLSRHWKGFDSCVERTPVHQLTIARRAGKRLNPLRAQGKYLVDVAFSIHDRRQRSSLAQPFRGNFNLTKPAVGFLLLKCPPTILLAAASDTIPHLDIDKPKQTATGAIYRNHRMDQNTPGRSTASHRPKARRPQLTAAQCDLAGIMDHHDITARRSFAGARAHCRGHLHYTHPLVAQKPMELHLATALAGQSANAASLALHQRTVKLRPPFSRRRSPNRPDRSLSP